MQRLLWGLNVGWAVWQGMEPYQWAKTRAEEVLPFIVPMLLFMVPILQFMAQMHPFMVAMCPFTG